MSSVHISHILDTQFTFTHQTLKIQLQTKNNYKHIPGIYKKYVVFKIHHFLFSESVN